MHNLALWDIAAGCLIVQEAGGLIGDFEGGLEHLKSGNLVAANPRLFKTLGSLTQVAPNLERHLVPKTFWSLQALNLSSSALEIQPGLTGGSGQRSRHADLLKRPCDALVTPRRLSGTSLIAAPNAVLLHRV